MEPITRSKARAILRRKKITGFEAGKALITSLAYETIHADDKKPPLFLPREMRELESKIPGETEWSEYEIYRSIYRSFFDHHDKCQALIQQFYHGIYRARMTLTAASAAEEWETKITKLPYIMTQKQYHTEANAVKRYLLQKKDNLYSIFFTVLEAFLNDESAAPIAVQAALKTAKEEPATNPRILENYNYDMGHFRPFVRGSQDAKYSPSKTWAAELMNESIRVGTSLEALNEEERAKEIFFNGPAAIREYLERKSPGALPPCTDEELEEAYWYAYEPWNAWLAKDKNESARGMYGKRHAVRGLQHLIDVIRGIITPLPFLPEIMVDPAPVKVTKYDILTNEDTLDRYHGGHANRIRRTGTEDLCQLIKEIPIQNQLEEFFADYPDLTTAIISFICQKVPAAATLTKEQRFQPLFACGELEKAGMPGYEQYTTPTDRDFTEYYQITDNWWAAHQIHNAWT